MPSPFEKAFSGSALPTLYATFGLPATYADPGSHVSSGLTVRVHRGETRTVDGDNKVRREVQTGEVFVLQSSLAKPVKGGRFTVESVEVWTIVGTPVLKNGQFCCNCERSGAERMIDRRERD